MAVVGRLLGRFYPNKLISACKTEVVVARKSNHKLSSVLCFASFHAMRDFSKKWAKLDGQDKLAVFSACDPNEGQRLFWGLDRTSRNILFQILPINQRAQLFEGIEVQRHNEFVGSLDRKNQGNLFWALDPVGRIRMFYSLDKANQTDLVDHLRYSKGYVDLIRALVEYNKFETLNDVFWQIGYDERRILIKLVQQDEHADLFRRFNDEARKEFVRLLQPADMVRLYGSLEEHPRTRRDMLNMICSNPDILARFYWELKEDERGPFVNLLGPYGLAEAFRVLPASGMHKLCNELFWALKLEHRYSFYLALEPVLRKELFAILDPIGRIEITRILEPRDLAQFYGEMAKDPKTCQDFIGTMLGSASCSAFFGELNTNDRYTLICLLPRERIFEFPLKLDRKQLASLLVLLYEKKDKETFRRINPHPKDAKKFIDAVSSITDPLIQYEIRKLAKILWKITV
jgi:Mg/Co/Ni transporter MgtE